MYDFEYHRPATLAEAARLLAAKGDNKLLAGGMSLIPSLKMRLNRYSALVDLGAVQDIKGIRREGDALVIGAMTPHAVVAASAEVRKILPAIASLAEGIGDPLVRNRGTMGGSIANADPAADYPAAVVSLGATVVTNQRSIAADNFFTGVFETALAPDGIIMSVRFPIPQRAAYAKYRQPASRFAIVGVFVAQTADGMRVAVTGAGPSVFRFAAAEAALTKRFEATALDCIQLPAAGLNSDLHASNVYRAHAVVEMAKRAVTAALK
jgi:aerobic carbon-monoxide dehydrogenase medium subunit